MKEAFVGFDSAWGGHRAGAMAWVVFQNEFPDKCALPRLVGFADAAEIIEDLQRECDDVLVAIDQPIIVPNDVGSRPVDCIADSVMQHLKSSALRANRTERGEGFNNTYLHGNEAPIWKFMSRIGPFGYSGTTDRDDKGAFVDFQAAQMPTDDCTHRTHVIEVYPALALTALNPIFMCRGSTARYDPENYGGGTGFLYMTGNSCAVLSLVVRTTLIFRKSRSGQRRWNSRGFHPEGLESSTRTRSMPRCAC